ncbi:MAG: LamG domain-containing protein [Acidobacteriota bacterium]
MTLLLLLALAADPKAAHTFKASLDKGVDADFAKGDQAIYFAPSYKDLSTAVKGLGQAPVALENGALRFKSKHTTALFYRIRNNVNPTEGTISFKLKLDPALDLPPDYVDPIQFTDKAYNDSAIWVDFTRDDKPRLFRLGVFGELKAWNPNNLPPDKNPKFDQRLVAVKNPPFSRQRWTHVVITYKTGSASLYLDGKLQGNSSPITEPFTWNLDQATIRLGVNYAGLFDDLSVYNRVLTPAEIAKLK